MFLYNLQIHNKIVDVILNHVLFALTFHRIFQENNRLLDYHKKTINMKVIVQTILFTKILINIISHKLKSFLGFFIKKMFYIFYFFLEIFL